MRTSIRIARISRPEALRGASESAQTFAKVAEFHGGASDPECKSTESTADALEKTEYGHISGIRESQQHQVNNGDILKKMGMCEQSATHYNVQNLRRLKNVIRELESQLGITYLISECVGRGGNEIVTELHCDSGEIPTKAGRRAKIGIFVCLRISIAEATTNEHWRA